MRWRWTVVVFSTVAASAIRRWRWPRTSDQSGCDTTRLVLIWPAMVWWVVTTLSGCFLLLIATSVEDSRCDLVSG
jgi:hypothetical protein